MTAIEMVDETLRASGWPGADALRERRWIDAQGSFAESHFLGGFGHADRKFHFRADWASLGPYHAGMPSLPDFWNTIDVANEARPFRLVTAPSRQFLNSTFTETPTGRKRERRPTALIHPRDAARLEAVDGGVVRLGNAQGEVLVHARIFDGVQPGVVVVEGVWPNADFPGGIGINVLTSDDPAAPAGGAVFHDTAVWVRAETATLAEAAD